MDRLDVFYQYRSLLLAIAYRMLGSASEAEDMVQEAWIRWQATPTQVQSPKAFLSTVITRLCIDQLRSARVQREKYIGIWLPEPLIAQQHCNTGNDVELAESVSYAFLTLLECLSPMERAIFLLREVFDYEYSDIAFTVGKSIPACRQIVRRARQHLAVRRPNMSLTFQQKEELVAQFLSSWNQGDVYQLVKLMAEDITFWSDGGGQVYSAHKPLHGCQKVARFLIAIRRSRLIPIFNSQIQLINAQPGILNVAQGKPQSIFSFEFVSSNIQSIFAVVNPEKLTAIHLKSCNNSYHTVKGADHSCQSRTAMEKNEQ